MSPAITSARSTPRPEACAGTAGVGELRFRATFEGAAIGIGICTLDGHILEGNPALAAMLGYSRGELAAMHPREFHPGDFQQDEALLAELMRDERESFQLDKRYRRKDGSYFWGHLTVSIVHDAGGNPAFLIAMLEDISERKRAAEQLRESEKMEVIGRLAGGIAHDFNNLLTGILLYCDLLASELDAGGRQRKLVDEIRMAGEQGAALTQQLLAIARKQTPQRRPLAINELIRSTENLLRRLIGEQIELTSRLSQKPAIVVADPAQIRQVLLNLVLNARDAMPQGGRIRISTYHRVLPGTSEPAVGLAIDDNGCGMDETTRARLFEPFFTTKQEGHGTGLGLSTVQRIVAESGGMIEVKSSVGRGTRMEVILPSPKGTTKKGKFTADSHKRQSILLVDDHNTARVSMRRLLQEAGYSVFWASNGPRAEEVFTEHAADIDLLLTDRAGDGMNGLSLAEKLRCRKQELKVLFIAGNEDKNKMEDLQTATIQRPFTGHILIEHIRKLLHSNGGPPC